MSAVVLDAGALIALDRNDRATWALLRVAADDGDVVLVPTGVVGQTWRDGARQALLSRALDHCEEVPLDGVVARAAGLLCGRTDTADVIDASVALAAAGAMVSGPVSVLTSDLDDLARLTGALRRSIDLIEV
ncbi:MAG: twitching motility protein PilT [Actinomycetota bacterium]